MSGVNMHLENKSVSKKFFWMLWIMYAVVYMTKSCYSGAMASIVHEGVLTKSQTGLITASFYFVYAPLQILGGIFADKYNPEKMIKIGLVGSGVANLINIFQPEKICIGGGISNEKDALINPINETVRRFSYTRHTDADNKVCVAKLGNDAGIIGAAFLDKLYK